MLSDHLRTICLCLLRPHLLIKRDDLFKMDSYTVPVVATAVNTSHVGEAPF